MYLKLFEKSRCQPSLNIWWTQPRQTHTNALGLTTSRQAASKVNWVFQSSLPISAAGRGVDELPSEKEVCPIPTAYTGHRHRDKDATSRAESGQALQKGLLLWLAATVSMVKLSSRRQSYLHTKWTKSVLNSEPCSTTQSPSSLEKRCSSQMPSACWDPRHVCILHKRPQPVPGPANAQTVCDATRNHPGSR